MAGWGHRVVGIDLSESAIRKYRAKGFEGHAGNLEDKIALDEASVDIVFCSEVIEHLVWPENFLAEARRVLKPLGKLIVSTPNSAFWLYRLLGCFGRTVSDLQHPRHLHFYSADSLRKLLESSGFRIVRRTGRNMYLLIPGGGPPLLGRVLEKLKFSLEMRMRTGRPFWHLSHKSRFFSSFFSDTLIFVASKRGPE